MRIDISRFYLIERELLAKYIYYFAIIIAFFASMNVWFLIPVHTLAPIIVFPLIVFSMALSQSSPHPLFNETYFVIPTMLFLTFNIYQCVVNGINVNGYIISLFNTFLVASVFLFDRRYLLELSTLLSKLLGGWIACSLPFFLLYILGFSLPNSDLVFNDGFYYFSNYYLFLVDERGLFAIIPRFQSIFLEPTYLGSITALLLLTQRGKWKKWYNVSLLIALLISFSLAGYGYLVAILFLNPWALGKKVFKKALFSLIAIGLFVGGAFFYKGGENLVHDLILLRLEVDDGDLVGNNRVTKDFDEEFREMLHSSDALLGREFDSNEPGNSGYKAFIYDNGLVGTAILFLFYIFALAKAPNMRAMISTHVVWLLIWGVDGFVLWFGRFLPLYLAAYIPVDDKSKRFKKVDAI